MSIFIPLSDEDENDPIISVLYPFKTVLDSDEDGYRYNLLPSRQQHGGHEPTGTFPDQSDILSREEILEVYEKYYKYTALTNFSGDYMIFGVPIGTQTVHLSVDITDIGEYSMTPAAMVTNLGYSPNLFTDNNSRIKPSTDLNDLPNIETQEITVDIIPFWGDVENFEIGISRQDFRIRSVLSNTFVLFGSVFTDGSNSMWGEDFYNNERRIAEMFRARKNENTTVGMYSKQIGKVTEKIYYYPPEISDINIDAGYVNPKKDMRLLDPSEYSVYKRDGDFAFIINCNNIVDSLSIII